MKANKNVLIRKANFIIIYLIYLKIIYSKLFKYSSLVWIFHERQSNKKISQLHERTLRIVYRDFESSFNEFFDKGNSFSIRHQNMSCLFKHTDHLMVFRMMLIHCSPKPTVGVLNIVCMHLASSTR